MKLQRNVGDIDRVIRLILAIVLVLAAYFYATGALRIVIYVVAVLLFLTGAIGFCGIYALLKMSTYKKPEAKVEGKGGDNIIP